MTASTYSPSSPAATRTCADVLGALSVARRAVVERQPEPLGVPLARPHLLGAGDVGDVVVLHAQQVPDQPADGVGVRRRAARPARRRRGRRAPGGRRRGCARRRRSAGRRESCRRRCHAPSDCHTGAACWGAGPGVVRDRRPTASGRPGRAGLHGGRARRVRVTGRCRSRRRTPPRSRRRTGSGHAHASPAAATTMSVRLHDDVLDLHVEAGGRTTHHRSRRFGRLDGRPTRWRSP